MDTSHLQHVVAEVAAQAQQEKKKAEDTLQLVIFTLDNEEYGVPITDLQEIIRMAEITPIPGAPEFIRGILNLRGKIVVVVDLEKRFHLIRASEEQPRHIIITEANESTFGVIVDRVIEVLRVPVSQIQPTPSVVSSKIHAEYLNGVVVIEEKIQEQELEECTQEMADEMKKSGKKHQQGRNDDSVNSRLIILLDLPKMLLEKDLISLGSSVSGAEQSSSITS